MKRCTTILIMCVALLAACNTPRKACRKADRLIGRAVWLCPDVLSRDSATVVTKPDSAKFQAEAGLVDVDSLLAACAALNSALMASQNAIQPREPVSITPLSIRNSKVIRAVASIQHAACDWQPFTDHFGRITVEVKNLGGTPLLTVIDPGETTKVPCPPTVNKVVVNGVATWYRTFFWVVICLVLILFVGFLLFAATHHAGP